MKDLFVVAVLDGECNLREPVQKLVLSQVILATLTVYRFEALFDLALQIAIVSVVHDNTQLALLCFVDFPEANDIRVVEDLQNLSLIKSLASLFLTHLSDVYLLNYCHCVV